jgi:hypothetical protein
MSEGEAEGEDKLCAAMCLRRNRKASISMDYLPAVKVTVATKAYIPSLDLLKVGKKMSPAVNMTTQQLMYNPFKHPLSPSNQHNQGPAHGQHIE